MDISEKELLDRIRKEPQAFALLYDRYYDSIFGYVYRRVGEYEIARDITAETFLKAYQKIDFYQWRNVSFSAWLYKIATNETNQFFRRAKYRPACLDDLKIRDQFLHEEGIETERAALEKAKAEHEEFFQIQTHLKQLDTKYQQVIALRFFESKSINEIAEILGKNVGTVKSLLSRGVEKLRKSIAS